MKTVDGRLVILAGASRSGKTAYARKATARDQRVFAWDIEDQWSKLPGFQRVTTAAEMVRAAATPGPQKIAYVAPTDPARAFAIFAGACFASVDRIGPAVIIAEELADVTHPGKAPAAWGMLVRRGLKRGATLYAISQRWAEADKTALGNASEFVIFRQSSADDVRYLAKKTRVPAAQIDALPPLHFIRYDAGLQTFTAGRLKF